MIFCSYVYIRIPTQMDFFLNFVFTWSDGIAVTKSLLAFATCPGVALKTCLMVSRVLAASHQDLLGLGHLLVTMYVTKLGIVARGSGDPGNYQALSSCSVTRMSFDHQEFFCTGSHTAVFQVTCMVIMVIIIGNVSRIAVGHIVTYIFFNITPRLSLSRRRGTVFVLTSCQHYWTIRFVSQTLFSVLGIDRMTCLVSFTKG